MASRSSDSRTKVRDHAEVFGDDLGARLAKHLKHPLPQQHL